ncbi:MAG: hypothetical protein J6K20_04760 [Thermoguttaceae bacterium]|nr:hypothetical protein [Thermoguttaceae bacterium]
MSDLSKSKAANALVWAAFFAFWLHSLHCCRAHQPTERCVFDSHCLVDYNDSTIADDDVFHRRQRRPISSARVFCRSSLFLTPPRFESSFAETPSFDRNLPVHKSRCAVAWSSLRLPTEKEIFGDFGAPSVRAFVDSSSGAVCSLSFVALLNRLNEAFSTPLYLRLRKILN